MIIVNVQTNLCKRLSASVIWAQTYDFFDNYIRKGTISFTTIAQQQSFLHELGNETLEVIFSYEEKLCVNIVPIAGPIK